MVFMFTWLLRVLLDAERRLVAGCGAQRGAILRAYPSKVKAREYLVHLTALSLSYRKMRLGVDALWWEVQYIVNLLPLINV